MTAMNNRMKMSDELKSAFIQLKPICDVVIVTPSVANIGKLMSCVAELKKEVVQELQQYLLFPFITHLKSKEMSKKYETQCRLTDTAKTILEQVTVKSYEMTIKIATCLLTLVVDNTKPEIIADVPEELKHSTVKCLTVLNLNLEENVRVQLMQKQVPLLAQIVFVSVHLAKIEKLRSLRLQSIECVLAYTVTHPKLTDDNYHIPDANLEVLAVDMVAGILPGLLAALQDVATCKNNPGHAIIVVALSAIHRILCIPMNDKHFTGHTTVTVEDFAKLVREKMNKKEEKKKAVKDSSKNIPKLSPEWYAMAGEKLTLITKSVVSLRTHEHFKVRKELSIYCARLLTECHSTMQPSIPIALDALISLSKDEYPEVADYCSSAVKNYFNNAPAEIKHRAIDSLCENFFATLTSLPRVLNNVDSNRKLSALNLLHGYIQVLCGESRPQRLTIALSTRDNMHLLCCALRDATALRRDLALMKRQCHRGCDSKPHPPSADVTTAPPLSAPWLSFRHLDTKSCIETVQETCQLLGSAECSELLLDRLLELFIQQRDCELLYIMNWMAAAPKASPNLAKRILATYLEEDVWYLPLEVGKKEAPITKDETLDVTVYNPRAWTKDSVPGLYEGATETRYTDISYQKPAVRYNDPNTCPNLAKAQKNMILSCLLTEGVGMAAKKLGEDYQPYLLRTLCMIIERVGNKYEMLSQAGLKAINGIASAGGHASVAELIKCNADYFTSQITNTLKKSYNTQSALQMLYVVMEYSDQNILNCLNGIVQDVLMQSFDKFYEKNLHAYLKVFLTFFYCLFKWFPTDHVCIEKEMIFEEFKLDELDLMKDVIEFVKNKQDADKLLESENEMEEESNGTISYVSKTGEEMYIEDLAKKQDEILLYDDKVTGEQPDYPQHVVISVAILRRCLNFVCNKIIEEPILVLQVLTMGLPILAKQEALLLPFVHHLWSPLATILSTTGGHPVVLRKAFELLVTVATLSKDFIKCRTSTDCLPHLYRFFRNSATESFLKDAGAAYRSTHNYNYQVTALSALPLLLINLGIDGHVLEEAMQCVDLYLSRKQPKPLQELAVKFYKVYLEYDYGLTWHHLRTICSNVNVITPPKVKGITLKTIVGTPYEPTNKDIKHNIKAIFTPKKD